MRFMITVVVCMFDLCCDEVVGCCTLGPRAPGINIAQAQSDDEEWDIGPILGVIFSLIFVFIILPIAIFILISICCIFGTATVAHYCCWRHSDRNVTTAVPATPEVVVLTSELPVVAYPASGYDHSKQEAMPPPYGGDYLAQETAVGHPTNEAQQPGYPPQGHPGYP